MRTVIAAVVLVLAAGAGAGHAAETGLVDATLAVVADSLVTLSDVTLARALEVQAAANPAPATARVITA